MGTIRTKSDMKTAFIVVIATTLIGYVGTGFGKYDHVHWSLGGFCKQQFTVGDNNEQITVRLNTSGRNWDLDFDEEEEIILVEQDGETLLGGWFIPLDGFASWEQDFLSMEEYTVIIKEPAEEPAFYSCLLRGEQKQQFVFLTKIDGSEHSIIFFTPDDAEIAQEKAEEAFSRITVTKE